MSEFHTPKTLGRYEIVRELGKGAMGVVYEGRDPNIGRRVAIKTARRDVMKTSGRGDEMMERFLREARAAGNLNHPNIITIFDADEQDGIAYIAMEFIEGGSLGDKLDAKVEFSTEQIVEIGATVAEALSAAHAQGVVHRDVKPDNILTPNDGPLKIADFGIARVSDSTLTQDGDLIGTPYYMSPEQYMGQQIDGRSDIFSLAVILYELLTREKPFQGEALSTMMHHVINTTPIPPEKLNLHLATPLSEVVMKGLSKKPGDRYKDGRAFAAALRESLKENPDPAVLGVNATATPAADKTLLQASGPADATVLSTSAPTGAAPPDPVADTAVQRALEPDPPPATPAKISKLQYGVAGGVFAILMFGLINLFLMTVDGNDTGGGTAAGATQKVNVEVWGTSDIGIFADWTGLEEDYDAKRQFLRENNQAVSGVEATLTVTNLDSNETQDFSLDKTGDTVALPLDAERLKFEIGAEGYKGGEKTIRKQDGAWPKQLFLLQQDASTAHRLGGAIKDAAAEKLNDPEFREEARERIGTGIRERRAGAN